MTAPKLRHESPECSRISHILGRMGDKWSLLVISLLEREPMRFSELKRACDGISQRMLTLTLRQLERDGLVARTVTPIIPPRVDYALTDLGQSLGQSVSTVVRWAIDNGPAMDAARTVYDAGQAGEADASRHPLRLAASL